VTNQSNVTTSFKSLSASHGQSAASPQITEIELIPVKATNGLVAFATLVLDNKLFLGNIAIFTRISGEGFRCVYPTKKLPNGQQVPVYYPINKETNQAIEFAVTDKLNQLFGANVNQ
jgi:DNA-binding cell septation regulator SpoVG